MTKRQKEWIEESKKFKVGDEVRIARPFRSNADIGYISEQNLQLGKTGVVREVDNTDGTINVAMEARLEDYWWSPFSLYPIEKPKKLTPEKVYLQMQNTWVKLNNLKVGDKVKVVRNATNHESGWNNSWVEEMDDAIETVQTIRKFNGNQGIILVPNSYTFPYFSLEKVEEPKSKTIKVLSCNKTFICNKFDFIINANGSIEFHDHKYSKKSAEKIIQSFKSVLDLKEHFIYNSLVLNGIVFHFNDLEEIVKTYDKFVK